MWGKGAPQYKLWKERQQVLMNMPYHLKVVNTGSTAGYKAFDYAYWDVLGFNLGSQPQPLYYDFEVLKKYSDHIDRNAWVFICIEGFKFLVDHYEDRKANYKYYFYLDSGQIHGYEKKVDWQLRHFPFLASHSFLKAEVKSAFFKKVQSKPSMSTSCREQDEYHANRFLRMWDEEFGWDRCGYQLNERQRKDIETNYSRLVEMLDYCMSHAWKPVIVIVPFSPSIMTRLPENILEECLWKQIKKIEMSGAVVLDFYYDSDFDDVQLYEEAIALNERGKELFNRKLQGILQGGL